MQQLVTIASAWDPHPGAVPCSSDMYAQDSIDLLMRSGIDFDAHEARGIDVDHFGELLMCAAAVRRDGGWVLSAVCPAGHRASC